MHEVRRTFSFHDGGPPRGATVAGREVWGGHLSACEGKGTEQPLERNNLREIRCASLVVVRPCWESTVHRTTFTPKYKLNSYQIKMNELRR